MNNRLIEFIAVATVISIIAAIAIPMTFKVVTKVENLTTQMDILNERVSSLEKGEVSDLSKVDFSKVADDLKSKADSYDSVGLKTSEVEGKVNESLSGLEKILKYFK